MVNLIDAELAQSMNYYSVRNTMFQKMASQPVQKDDRHPEAGAA
jgi:hypothetical protein